MSFDLVSYILIFLGIICIVLLTNLYKWYRTNKICNLYVEWLAKSEVTFNIQHYKSEVLSLVAVIPPKMLAFSQPLGYGQIANGHAYAMDQFPSRREDFASAILQTMEEAIGYYKFQVRQCINPIYWIEFFVWLPKRLTTFLGLNSELKAMKLVNLFFQLIYWAILLLKFFGYDFTPILHHVLP